MPMLAKTRKEDGWKRKEAEGNREKQLIAGETRDWLALPAGDRKGMDRGETLTVIPVSHFGTTTML